MMKRNLIALTLLFCTTANAEAIMWCLNENGNKIVLTDEFCANKKSMIAYVLSNNSETIMGCWTNDSLAVHVLWSGQHFRSYDYNGWTVVKKDSTM
jgi:hypothetical protein